MLSIKEIAEILNMNESEVRKTLFSAIRKIKHPKNKKKLDNIKELVAELSK